MCTIAYMRSRPTGSRIITGIDKELEEGGCEDMMYT